MKVSRLLVSTFTLGMAVAMIPGITASAATKIKIDKSNFPDKGLCKILSKEFDADEDGYLSSKEIKNTIVLSIYNSDKVSDLTGIEKLTSLKTLYVESTNLKVYDFSKNTGLTKLAVRAEIASADVSKLTKLENLWLDGSKIKSVDISKNAKLKDLMLSGGEKDCCMVQSVDLSSNHELESVVIYSDGLESLDVTKNHKLHKIYLLNGLGKGFTLKSVKLGSNKALKEVELGINAVESIDISKCPNIESFAIRSNKLSSLDLSKNRKLKALDLIMCSGLTEVDISNNTKLEEFDFDTGIVDKLIVFSGQKFESGRISDSGNRPKYVSSDKSVFTINTKTADSEAYKIVFEAKKAGSGILTEKINSTLENSTEIKVLYKDVTNKGDFWYEPTYYLSDKDIVKGYANQTEFRPANECTRAQMVTFLWRLNGSPAPKAKTTDFKDVKKGAYYYKAVIWAVEQGITTGLSKDKFGPEGVCTRAQTVTFLWRMAGKPEPKAKTCKFSDVKSSDYFYKATIWASENKIVAGYSDGTFQPSGKCLRRQMVTFLYKYDKAVNS